MHSKCSRPYALSPTPSRPTSQVRPIVPVHGHAHPDPQVAQAVQEVLAQRRPKPREQVGHDQHGERQGKLLKKGKSTQKNRRGTKTYIRAEEKKKKFSGLPWSPFFSG